jgi:hypothetical protein
MEFSLVALKEVNDSGVAEQGADQIGAGLGADLVLESQKLGLVGIAFKRQEVDGAGQAVAAVEWIHGATLPLASAFQS